jgi:ABC-type lipoprotein export system ATPase subunit
VTVTTATPNLEARELPGAFGALIGESGAGKSTMVVVVKALQGDLALDSRSGGKWQAVAIAMARGAA